ncbi:gamma-glutamyl-gamma-aminobutyrate hydrolase family protein [Spirillospora sp. NPDC052269]
MADTRGQASGDDASGGRGTGERGTGEREALGRRTGESGPGHGPGERGAEPPLIGITTYQEPARWGVWVREAAVLPLPYIRAVERAGGVPVLLPPTGTLRGVRALVDGLDGVVLAGGSDVDPELYGAERHPETSAPQPLRDRFELALVRAAIAADLPFLGICRGLQLLNVARGGGLVQHLPDAVGHKRHAPDVGTIGWHRVRISATSLTGKILGDVADVPSYHHQAADRLGKGLAAVAWADDQVVEAVELQGHRFGLAVQWHPEEGEDRRLFEALVAEASAR